MIGCLAPILGGYKFPPSATAAKVGAREETYRHEAAGLLQRVFYECLGCWAPSWSCMPSGWEGALVQCLSLVGFRDYLGKFWVNETQILTDLDVQLDIRLNRDTIQIK